MANISQEILSSAGFKNLASKAPADSLDKEGVTEVRQSAKQEIEELKAALATNGQNAVLNEYFKDPTARKALLDLIDEVEKNPPQATPAAAVATPAATASAPAVATPASAEIPKDVKDLIASITGDDRALDKVFGKMSKPGSKEYYSAWRAFKSILPGMEVSNEKDFEDFLNQKRSYTEAFIKWLENEYTSPNLALTYKTHIFENKSGKPGWYPAPATEPRIFTSLALKQSAIKTDLGNILEHLNTAAKNAPEQGVDWLSTSLTWGAPLLVLGGVAILAYKKVTGVGTVANAVGSAAGTAARGAGNLGVAAARRVPGMINNATYGRQSAPTTTPEEFAKRVDGLRNAIIESIVTNRDQLSNNRPGAVVDLPAHPSQVDYNAAETAIRNNPILRKELEARLTQLNDIKSHINAGNIRMTVPQLDALLGDVVRGKKFALRDLNPFKGAGVAGNTLQLVDHAAATAKRKFGKDNSASARVDASRIANPIHAAIAHAALSEQIGAAANMPAPEWQAFEVRIATTTTALEHKAGELEALIKELADTKAKKEVIESHNEGLRQATETRDAAQRRYDAEHARIHTAADALSAQVATARSIRDGHQNTVNALDAEIADLTAKIQAIKDPSLVGSEVPGVADIDTAIGEIDAKIKKEEAKVTRAKDPSLVASEVPGVADIDTAIGEIDRQLPEALDKSELNTKKDAKIKEKNRLISEYTKGIEGTGGALEDLATKKAGKTLSRTTTISTYISDTNTALETLQAERKAKVQERDRLIAPERAALEKRLGDMKLQKSQAQLPLTEASGKLAGLEESLRQSQVRLATLETALHTAQDALTARGVAKPLPRMKTVIEGEITAAHGEMTRLTGELGTTLTEIGNHSAVNKKLAIPHYSPTGGLHIGGEKVTLGEYHTKVQTWTHTGLKAVVKH